MAGNGQERMLWILLTLLCALIAGGAVAGILVAGFASQPSRAGMASAPALLVLAARLAELELLQQHAMQVGHPLLAEEIKEAVDQGKAIYPERSSMTEALAETREVSGDSWLDAVRGYLDRHQLSSLKRRVRCARFAYWLNLPIGRESAANFAVLRMADRVERLAHLAAPRLEAFATREGRSGSRV